MNTPSQISPAQSSDLIAIIQLDHIARASSSRQAFIQSAVLQSQCHLAIREDQIVGYLILNYTFFNHGFIPLLYVAEPHRRSGVATALLQHARQICLTPKLFTSTNASNAPMCALLLSQSFHPSGTIENLDDADPELIFLQAPPAPRPERSV